MQRKLRVAEALEVYHLLIPQNLKLSGVINIVPLSHFELENLNLFNTVEEAGVIEME